MVAAGRRISGPGRRERSGDGSGPTPRRELGGPVPPAREAHGAGPSGLPGLGSSQRARSGAAAEEPRPPSGGRARAEARFLARPWVALGRRRPPRGGATPGSLSAARARLIPGESRAIPSEGSAPGSPRGRRLAPGPREGCRAAIARRRSTGRRLRTLPVIEAAKGHDRSARPRAAVRSRSLPDAAAAGSISEPSHGPRGRRTGVPGSPRRGFAAPLQGAPIRRVERAIERLEAGRGRIPTSSPEASEIRPSNLPFWTSPALTQDQGFLTLVPRSAAQSCPPPGHLEAPSSRRRAPLRGTLPHPRSPFEGIGIRR